MSIVIILAGCCAVDGLGRAAYGIFNRPRRITIYRKR